MAGKDVEDDGGSLREIRSESSLGLCWAWDYPAWGHVKKLVRWPVFAV